MSLRINHNTSAINAHRNLQANDMALSKSLEKLSSGLKINRAADGPASLVISEQMRAQIGGLEQAVNNSESAISMVQTAEGALNEVNTLLVRMRQLAIHAANEGANDDIMLAADQQEIKNSLATVNRISSFTQFGTKKLLDGSNGANGSATGEDVQFIRASEKTRGSEEGGYDVRIQQNASQASTTGTTKLTTEMIGEGETFTITEGGKTATYTAKELDNVDTMVQNLNSTVRQAGLAVNIELGGDGMLTATHHNSGSKHSFQVASTTAGVLSQEAGKLSKVANGKDIVATINGEQTEADGQTFQGVSGAKNIDGLVLKYTGEADLTYYDEDGNPVNPKTGEALETDEDGNAIKPAASEKAEATEESAADVEKDEEQVYYDSNGNEVDPDEGVLIGNVQVTQNSLNFQVGANRGQSVRISLLNTAAGHLSKGVENASNFKNLADIDVTSSQGAQDALLMIDNAVNEVTRTRADLGAFQKNTLESNLSNLRIARENLVAAESSIRDADMAGEMAKFTRDQIMMQSATAMLAQANQVPDTILQLLG